MRKPFIFALISLFALAAPAMAEPSALYEYDAKAPLNPVLGAEKKISANAVSQPVTFDGGDKRKVIGQIIRSTRPGSHPGILFVHWLGEEKTSNFTEFESDAIALAEKGVTSVMVNALWSDPKWFDTVGRNSQADIAQAASQVIDLRRALDLLQAQKGVDSKRIAVVGHDFGGMFSALLATVDTRPKAYVFLAAVPTFSEWYLLGKKAPNGDYVTLLDTTLDITGALKSAKAKGYLFQFANSDRYVPLDRARILVDATPLPHGEFLYKADHDLDVPEAHRDRRAWLIGQLFD